MVQFNLLPDVKVAFLKTRRTKRLVILGSIALSALSIAGLVGMFLLVNVLEKNNLKDLEDQSKKTQTQIESIQGVNKVLTVQNQLDALPGLHKKKPAVSKLFVYLSQLTPSEVRVQKLSVDFDRKTMEISGSSDTPVGVNKYVDTLKFAKYRPKNVEGQEPKPAFIFPTLESASTDDKGTNYKISLGFDLDIFENYAETLLIVPNIVSTRSTVENPRPLFEKAPEPVQAPTQAPVTTTPTAPNSSGGTR
jgi:Tfp pilus assembly protein PilN